MNEMEKYLDALETAVEIKDKKAMELLDEFSAYVYHEIHARTSNSSGEERTVWEGLLTRAKALICGMSQSAAGIWD